MAFEMADYDVSFQTDCEQKSPCVGSCTCQPFGGDCFHSLIVTVNVRPLWILQFSLTEQQYKKQIYEHLLFV